MSSVTRSLKRNKRNQGNFLPNHSRPDPANIYYGALVGLLPSAGSPQSHRRSWDAFSIAHLGMCAAGVKSGTGLGVAGGGSTAHLPEVSTCVRSCPGSGHRVFSELPLALGRNPLKYLHVFCSYSNRDIATVCLT